MKNKGFTLIELMLVMVVLVILMIIMVGTINPTVLINKGKDARKKKDVGRIKVAFEEYFNDKGCYPTVAMLANLMEKSNCSSNIFSPWFSSWPCDPNGNPYRLAVEEVPCPHWFKIFAKLENTKDSDIPDGWGSTQHVGSLTYNYNGDEVNFGTASTNVWWYDFVLPGFCEYGGCYRLVSNEFGEERCNTAGSGCGTGDKCFRHPSCDSGCQVPSCP